MSARPEWMPTHEDVEEQSDLHIGWVDDEAMDFLYHVGLRAQIAAFKWLREDAEDMMTNALSDWLQSREEALQKELGE